MSTATLTSPPMKTSNDDLEFVLQLKGSPAGHPLHPQAVDVYIDNGVQEKEPAEVVSVEAADRTVTLKLRLLESGRCIEAKLSRSMSKLLQLHEGAIISVHLTD